MRNLTGGQMPPPPNIFFDLRIVSSATELKMGKYIRNTDEPGYNDIGLYDTPSIASDILWYQLIPYS
jgi:hypothetical protein